MELSETKLGVPLNMKGQKRSHQPDDQEAFEQRNT